MAEEEFYRNSIQLLNNSGIDFLIGGAYAMNKYTGIYRDTKDIDIFCYESDYLQILELFHNQGYIKEVTDQRWVAKVKKDDLFLDIIFNSINSICPVEKSWFEHAQNDTLYGKKVRYMAPEELFWTKMYIQHRDRYDGADLNHLILKNGISINWQRILDRVNTHWKLLLSQLINFQFVYPNHQHLIPEWLIKYLLEKMNERIDLINEEEVSRGHLLDKKSYDIDILKWKFKTIYD